MQPNLQTQTSSHQVADELIGESDVRRPLLSVAQLVEAHPYLTPGGVRADIFGAEIRHTTKGIVPGNGLAPAIIRKGRRVLIDEIGYLTWVRTGRVDAFLLREQATRQIAGVPK